MTAMPRALDSPATPDDARPWLRAYPPGIAWDQALPEESLLDILDGVLARHPDAACLDFLGRSWTYRQFGDAVQRVAAGLRRLGAGPGTRVGLCLPNTPFAVIAHYAVLRAGAVVVNFNPLSPAGLLATQRADSGTTILFTIDIAPIFGRARALLDQGLEHLVVCRFHQALTPVKAALFRLARRSVRAQVPSGDARIRDFADLLAIEPGPPHPRPAPRDLAVLQYTGGTTGTPKGAALSHANLAANVRQVLAWFPHYTPGGERMLGVLPLSHVFGMTAAMNVALAMAAELVLLPRFDARQMLAVLRRRRPSILPGVPTLYKAILDAGATRAQLGSVRYCISGGAPLPLDVARAFEAASSAILVEGYGLTEAAPVCFCNPPGAGRRIGTIGLPLPGVAAEIRALDDPARRLPPGARGELCVRGPNVMAQYWNRPAESEAAFTADGWLRTGDVGIMSEDGYVTLVDRIKDLILCSGFNVYPRTIEEALYGHPAVVAATALGMPDAYRGESVAVFVQLQPGSSLTPSDLRAFLADRLSAIEMPRLIELRDSLPRTAVGKLSRTELRAELAARAASRQQPDSEGHAP